MIIAGRFNFDNSSIDLYAVLSTIYLSISGIREICYRRIVIELTAVNETLISIEESPLSEPAINGVVADSNVSNE